jgi:NAD(P)H-hydrate epimerase
MEAAGRAVADEVLRLERRRGASACILCGPGNNGGDGFVAARVLADHGLRVRVGLLGARDSLRGDAAAMAALWSGPVEVLSADLIDDADVVVDALFGAGLSRPLEGAAAAVVEALNRSSKRVVAVDVPSGLDGASGQAAGTVVQATRTVTFFRRKPGHLLYPGRALCGSVTVADIGIPPSVLTGIGARTWANAPGLWQHHFPRPRSDGHKYCRGHVVAVSGPADCTGAIRLGARAALRIGAGLVSIAGSPAATAVNAVHSTAVMVRTAAADSALAELLADARHNAVLYGPGASVAAGTTATVETILRSGAAVVLDADALTSFATDAASRAGSVALGFMSGPASPSATPSTLFDAIAARAAAVVLTPHEGEFKRLFPALAGIACKLERACTAARASGAVVVLKGPDTVIAAPDGRAAINENAPPWLATAGSGDVLAGMIAGLLAQGMPAFEAACAAVWMHGEAAVLFGAGLIAEDLPEMLPSVLTRLLQQASSSVATGR